MQFNVYEFSGSIYYKNIDKCYKKEKEVIMILEITQTRHEGHLLNQNI